jgi:membrane dipeptidase
MISRFSTFHAAALPLLMLSLSSCCVLGSFADRKINPVTSSPKPASAIAQSILNASASVDLHADTLLWEREFLSDSPNGHVTLAGLQQSNVGLQVFSTVSSLPLNSVDKVIAPWIDIFTAHCALNCWRTRTWFSPFERTMYQFEHFRTWADKSNNRLRLIRSQKDFAELNATRASGGTVGAILSVEGAQALEDKLENVEIFFDEGLRMMGLVHLGNNSFAGSRSLGNDDIGLTPMGEKLVQELERKNIIIDLAHASTKTIEQTLAVAKRPPIVSHTGVRGTCDNARNLSDKELKDIAAKGGIVGIAFFEKAVCGKRLEDIANAILYTVQVIGPSKVALGSDFDGGVPIPLRAHNLGALADALLDKGLTPTDVTAIFGGNARRFLESQLPSQ